MAHVHGFPDNEQEFNDDLFGKGTSDPDVVGHYPGQEDLAENQNTDDTLEKINP